MRPSSKGRSLPLSWLRRVRMPGNASRRRRRPAPSRSYTKRSRYGAKREPDTARHKRLPVRRHRHRGRHQRRGGSPGCRDAGIESATAGHGGLRYLQYYEFALVRESLRDREELLRMAPHLVKPLGFLVPVYDYMSRGKLMVQAGMIAYDALSYDKSLERHHIYDREQTLERYPGLNSEGLKGAAFYYDAQVEYAERIPVENAISAHENGAVVLTYTKVDRIVVEDGRATGVEFENLLGGGRYAAHAPVILNMAGPWVDEVLGGMNRAEERMIGGTKGSHLIVDPFPGAPQTALYVEAQEDG